MMTYDEIKELYDKELNTIYTSEELKFHQKERMLKSWFEITHAHNYDLIDLIDATNDYLFNGAPKPQRKLWVMLRPGNNNENAVCARIQSINNYFAKYEHGETPLLPIIAYASKSTRTLITKLDEFHFHKSISDLDHYVKEYFCLVAYQGEPMMNRDEFANKLNELSNAFISSMTEYARDLCEWTHKCEADLKHGEKTIKVEIVKPSKPKKTNSRGHGKHTSFMEKQIIEFKKYLDKKPICASYSNIARARECWNLHKTEWEKAAKSGIGYANYKILGTAIKNTSRPV